MKTKITETICDSVNHARLPKEVVLIRLSTSRQTRYKRTIVCKPDCTIKDKQKG